MINKKQKVKTIEEQIKANKDIKKQLTKDIRQYKKMLIKAKLELLEEMEQLQLWEEKK